MNIENVFRMYSSHHDAVGLDGVTKIQLEFAQGFKTLSTLQENQKDLEEKNIQPDTSKTGSSSCQCSMISCGKLMIRIASRTKKSRITWRFSYHDIGLFWSKIWIEMICRLSRSTGTVGSHGQKKKMVQQFKETGHPIFISTSALSHGILMQRKRKKYHSLQWRHCEYGTLVSNSSWSEPDQYVCGCLGLVLSIRFDKSGIRTSHYSCGHWNFDYGVTRRSENMGITSEPGTWKQDARRRTLPNMGKQGTEDTILCKAMFQHLVTARNCYQFRPDRDYEWRNFIPRCREWRALKLIRKLGKCQLFPQVPLLDRSVIHVVQIFDEKHNGDVGTSDELL